MITMYGIPNCDTIKKAKKWLDSQGTAFEFHDYKKAGVKRNVIETAIKATAVNIVVNKRGTTFRKLSDANKALVEQSTDVEKIVDLLCDNPSMIKRPILWRQTQNEEIAIIVGFTDSTYQEFINAS